MTLEELQTPCTPNWCPGCGNLNIWAAFKNAAVKEGWDNTNTALVAGIGCHGHILNFIKLTSFGFTPLSLENTGAVVSEIVNGIFLVSFTENNFNPNNLYSLVCVILILDFPTE